MVELCEHCNHKVGMTTSSALFHVKGRPNEEAEFSTTCWECGCRYPKIKTQPPKPSVLAEED